MVEPKPNTVDRDETGKASGITARRDLCSWSSSHFTNMAASVEKMDHMERAHGCAQ